MARPRLVLFALLAGTLAVTGPVVSSDAAEVTYSASVPTESARLARPRVTLQVHPQIAQPGDAPASASSARSAMTATFTPRDKGRPVKLQRKTGQRWVTVAKARQNGLGRAEFSAAYAVNGTPATYRVTAPRFRGAKALTSMGAATSVADAPGFLDDFSASELDPATWGTRAADYEPRSKRKCSKSSPDAVSVSGGTVRLQVLNDPARPSLTDQLNGTQKCSYDGETYDWRVNGHIGTEESYSFTYGYAAARIKFQPRLGQHGAFWLMPESQNATEGPTSSTGAEIDVIEWFGPDRHGGLASFIHHWPVDNTPGITPTKVGGYLEQPSRFGKNWASSYHVFSVEWTPQRYVFRIDGKETFRTSQGVSARPEYLILSLLSSDYEMARLGGEQNLPQTMNVDWVRTWER